MYGLLEIARKDSATTLYNFYRDSSKRKDTAIKKAGIKRKVMIIRFPISSRAWKTILSHYLRVRRASTENSTGSQNCRFEFWREQTSLLAKAIYSRQISPVLGSNSVMAVLEFELISLSSRVKRSAFWIRVLTVLHVDFELVWGCELEVQILPRNSQRDEGWQQLLACPLWKLFFEKMLNRQEESEIPVIQWLWCSSCHGTKSGYIECRYR